MARDHILVVDDEQPIRALLVEVLAAEGYEADDASNGEAALDAISRTPPRLVLLDLHMPIMDGWTLVSSLVTRGMTVPIILVSAATNLSKHASDLGAVGFIAKPFEIRHLLAIVERHYRAA